MDLFHAGALQTQHQSIILSTTFSSITLQGNDKVDTQLDQCLAMTHLVTRVKNARKKNPTYRMNMQSKQRNEYKECMVSMMTNKTGPNGCEINFSNLKKRFTL